MNMLKPKMRRDPARRLRTVPVAAIIGRRLQTGAQSLKVRLRQKRTRPPVAAPQIAKRCCAIARIAFRQLVHPALGDRRDFRPLPDRAPLGQKPDDLKMGPLDDRNSKPEFRMIAIENRNPCGGCSQAVVSAARFWHWRCKRHADVD